MVFENLNSQVSPSVVAKALPAAGKGERPPAKDGHKEKEEGVADSGPKGGGATVQVLEVLASKLFFILYFTQILLLFRCFLFA